MDAVDVFVVSFRNALAVNSTFDTRVSVELWSNPL